MPYWNAGMQAASIENEEQSTATEPSEVDSEKGMWMRSCPHCDLLLFKYSRHETVRCACGWEWQS